MFSLQSSFRCTFVLVSLICYFFQLATADIVPASNYDYFSVNGSAGSTPQFAFALNVAENTNDLYFYLSGPSSASWIAVGTGSLMTNSMMFVVYTAANGKDLTLSPRIATSEIEPAFAPHIKLTLLPGTGIFNGTYIANALCKNCTTWSLGALDLKSKAQSWIYGWGSSDSLKSDDLTATIQRHDQFGVFTLDMTLATGPGGPPPATVRQNFGSAFVSQKQDHDYATLIHAVLSTLAFVIVMPLGVIFLRVLENVRWHWINQSLALAIAVIGVGLGFVVSQQYQKARSYNSGHQIIGIVVIVAVLVQSFLGAWHHRIYKREQRSTSYIGVHRYLGFVVIVAGMANGGFGLMYASNDKYVVPYAIVVAVIAVVVALGLLYVRIRNRRRAAYGVIGEQRDGDPWRGPAKTSDIDLRDQSPYRQA